MSSKGKKYRKGRSEKELLFINDDTGRKPIHPYALRYALKVVEQEAQRTTKLVAQEYEENGDLEMSRIVQVQASQHTRKIVERVRAALRTTKIPARYHRIEDINLGALELRNKKRREEMQELRNELERLENLCDEYSTREHQSAKSVRAPPVQEADGTLQDQSLHPLLHKFVVDTTKPMEHTKRAHVAVKRPTDPSKVFSALLGKLPSVYDENE